MFHVHPTLDVEIYRGFSFLTILLRKIKGGKHELARILFTTLC